MKYLKKFEKFEKLEDFPRVGNYCLLKPSFYNADIQNFFTNNIGKIIKIFNSALKNEMIIVNYEKDIIPDELLDFFKKNKYEYTRNFKLDCVEFFSNNKEDVEAFIQSNKYNL